MAVSYFKGQQLGPDDLFILIESASAGRPVNPIEISYALYDYDPITKQETLLGVPERTPVNVSVGHYYANIVIPLDAKIGEYRIRWRMREFAGAPMAEVVQPFDVIDKATLVSEIYTPTESELINELRIKLRDNDPDRNYHFRPPAHEESIRSYNRVFGQVWLDSELRSYLLQAMYEIIAAPPKTPFSNLDNMLAQFPDWRALLLTCAAKNALFALIVNANHEDYGYSIGGISLDLDRSSKYESSYQLMNDQFDKQLERAKQTVKFVKGLQQFKYGMGVRSAFGPMTSKGSLTPRKFVGI